MSFPAVLLTDTGLFIIIFSYFTKILMSNAQDPTSNSNCIILKSAIPFSHFFSKLYERDEEFMLFPAVLLTDTGLFITIFSHFR